MTDEYKPLVMWFRYCDPWTTGEVPWCQELPVKRETPKCVVLDEYGLERRVLKVAHKRYAYPTKELALESYIIRKQRQIQHCSRIHDAAKENLQAAQCLKRGEKVERKSFFLAPLSFAMGSEGDVA